MALVLRSGPSVEPICLDEAKAHLKVDTTDEDILISSLIVTSRLHIEAALGLALITQGFRLLLDRWPRSRAIRIPVRPVQSIDEIRVRDGLGGFDVVDPATYDVDVSSSPARIVCLSAPRQPSKSLNGLEVDLTAGYGDSADDVPAPIRQGLKLLVAHWYENRDPVEIGSPRTAIPQSVSNLVKPYRLVRL